MSSNSGDDGGIGINSVFLAAANDPQPQTRLSGSQVVEGQTENLVLTGLSDEQLLQQEFYRLPASIVRYLLRQAKSGHCPPLPILRRLGLKTASELADSGCDLPISCRIAG
jgi:hypothetical protein